LENKRVCMPVNQRVVSVQPTVSEDCGTTRIKRSDIKCLGGDFPSRKSDREIDGFGDDGIGGAVE
jgi:hypothetical protein